MPRESQEADTSSTLAPSVVNSNNSVSLTLPKADTTYEFHLETMLANLRRLVKYHSQPFEEGVAL